MELSYFSGVTQNEYISTLQKQRKEERQYSDNARVRQIDDLLEQRDNWSTIISNEVNLITDDEVSSIKYTSKCGNKAGYFEGKVSTKEKIHELGFNWVRDPDIFDQKYVDYVVTHSGEFFDVPVGS